MPFFVLSKALKETQGIGAELIIRRLRPTVFPWEETKIEKKTIIFIRGNSVLERKKEEKKPKTCTKLKDKNNFPLYCNMPFKIVVERGEKPVMIKKLTFCVLFTFL